MHLTGKLLSTYQSYIFLPSRNLWKRKQFLVMNSGQKKHLIILWIHITVWTIGQTAGTDFENKRTAGNIYISVRTANIGIYY